MFIIKAIKQLVPESEAADNVNPEHERASVYLQRWRLLAPSSTYHAWRMPLDG